MLTASYTYQEFERDSESLYAHWLNIKKVESPHDLLRRFNDLFIEGIAYQDPEILQVQNRILNSMWAEQHFKHILNRCCYILINHWWSQTGVTTDVQQATHRLVALFKTEPTLLPTTSEIARLREQVQAFTRTHQYEMLEQRVRLSGGHSQAQQPGSNDSVRPIRELIHRYPLLYPYYLRDDDTKDGRQYAIAQLQARQERQFEQQLSRCIINCVRHPNAVITGDNPTLLSDGQLMDTVRHFVGKAKDRHSYQDSARHFLLKAGQVQSHYEVKQQIHTYLTANLDPHYSDHYFSGWLHEQLSSALPYREHRRPSGSLLVQTCGHLLDTLIAHPKHSLSNHLVFVDLNNNLGATLTIGLLLKIVLLCRTVKANLDAIKALVNRHFAEMFKHYETQDQDHVTWLTECLDNLMVAYAIHFGQGSVSRWESLL